MKEVALEVLMEDGVTINALSNTIQAGMIVRDEVPQKDTVKKEQFNCDLPYGLRSKFMAQLRLDRLSASKIIVPAIEAYLSGEDPGVTVKVLPQCRDRVERLAQLCGKARHGSTAADFLEDIDKMMDIIERQIERSGD